MERITDDELQALKEALAKSEAGYWSVAEETHYANLSFELAPKLIAEVEVLRAKLALTQGDRDFCLAKNERYWEVLQLIAVPKRPDGTYNRSREACERLAREALEDGK